MVRPYTERFNVTFPVAVDTADVFGRAFGLKAIPVSFLVDEVGLVRLRGGGPTDELLRQIEMILEEPMAAVRGAPPELPAALSKEALQAKAAEDPRDWESRLALAQILDAEGRHESALELLERARGVKPGEPSILFTWGLVLMHQGRKSEALRKLKQARDLDPDNWRIRKQIWAIENPDKFYDGPSPDYDWQKEELAREKRERSG